MKKYNSNTPGIVYFIQPAELVGTDRYKIGCSEKMDLSRIKSYKKGTRYLAILACTDPYRLESSIISCFKQKFNLLTGNEYFEGSENDMIKEFTKIYHSYKADNSDKITGNIFTSKNSYICINYQSTQIVRLVSLLNKALGKNKIVLKDKVILDSFTLNNLYDLVKLNNKNGKLVAELDNLIHQIILKNKTVKSLSLLLYDTFSRSDIEKNRDRYSLAFSEKFKFLNIKSKLAPEKIFNECYEFLFSINSNNTLIELTNNVIKYLFNEDILIFDSDDFKQIKSIVKDSIDYDLAILLNTENGSEYIGRCDKSIITNVPELRHKFKENLEELLENNIDRSEIIERLMIEKNIPYIDIQHIIDLSKRIDCRNLEHKKEEIENLLIEHNRYMFNEHEHCIELAIDNSILEKYLVTNETDFTTIYTSLDVYEHIIDKIEHKIDTKDSFIVPLDHNYDVLNYFLQNGNSQYLLNRS